jgi:3-hydroxyisobutyrate dehydrogenase
MTASPENRKTKVAVLGLGLMGAGMARRLIGAGYQVSVYNRGAQGRAPFENVARVCASAREAAQDCDVVVSMVADDAASAAVWGGESGALSGIRPGALCIESSTVSPQRIAQWMADLAGAGCTGIDAPVTGSRAQAESGELKFIVGGAADAVARASSVLGAMATAVVHLGPAGSGAMFKLINNFLCGVQVASLAEAMVMIDRSGLARDKALETLLAGAPASPLVKALAVRMTEAAPAPNFLVRLMAKDLAYAAEAAASMGLDLATARVARASFDGATETGLGEQDIAAVYRFVGERAG